jgi:elongation factor 1-alpha
MSLCRLGYVETFVDYPPLGRIAVRDIKRTVAVGNIKSVKKDNGSAGKVINAEQNSKKI